MSMTSVRLLSAFSLFLLTMAAGALPPIIMNFWIRRKQKSRSITVPEIPCSSKWYCYENIMKMLMFFGGGILLATCFVHLIPEVRENLNHYFERQEHHVNETGDDASDVHDHEHEHHKHDHSIPHVELAVCVGFFIIYLLEEIVHMLVPHPHNDGSDTDSTGKSDSQSVPSLDTAPVVFGASRHSPDPTVFGYCDNRAFTGSTESCHVISSQEFGKGINPLPLPVICQQVTTRSTYVRFMQGLVIIIAFSAHSVFDGVAIGLQEETGRLWTTFFAISCHKLVVALAVGLELYEKTQSILIATIQMSLFASMSPIGILIVIATESSVSNNDSPIVILLSAVATGTILYIVFFEILQRERSDKTPKLFGILLYICMLTGFGVMFCLTLHVSH